MKAKYSSPMAVLQFLTSPRELVENRQVPRTKIQFIKRGLCFWAKICVETGFHRTQPNPKTGIVCLTISFLVLNAPSPIRAQTFHALDSHFYGSSCSDLLCPGASCYTPGECPNYCKCSITNTCIHSSGIVCDRSASTQPLGSVDVGVCSDYGRLNSGLSVHHNIGANGFSYGTAASFVDQISLLGGSGTAQVRVTFANNFTITGIASGSAGYHVHNTGLEPGVINPLEIVQNNHVPFGVLSFQLSSFLLLGVGANCGAASDGTATNSLRILRFEVTDTNNVPYTNATATGDSGTWYYGRPRIAQQPTNMVVCGTGSGTFQVSAETPFWDTLSYEWYKDDNLLPDQTGSNLTVTVPGNYFVKVSNSCGFAISDVVKFIVQQPPEIISQPQSVTLCGGGGFALSVTATDADVSYQWFSNNVAITGATNAMFTGLFSDSSPAAYEVVLSNYCGSVTSFPAVVSMVSPIGILLQPESQLICQGGSVIFIAYATNSDPLTYQWRKNGNDIAGAIQLFYSLTNAESSDAGTYTCVLSNACGAVLSSNATLEVMPCPRFISAGPLSNGAIQLRILGYPGSNYVTEAATNLIQPVAWIPIDTNTANGSSLILSTVNGTASFPQRFFRARRQ